MNMKQTRQHVYAVKHEELVQRKTQVKKQATDILLMTTWLTDFNKSPAVARGSRPYLPAPEGQQMWMSFLIYLHNFDIT